MNFETSMFEAGSTPAGGSTVSVRYSNKTELFSVIARGLVLSLHLLVPFFFIYKGLVKGCIHAREKEPVSRVQLLG